MAVTVDLEWFEGDPCMVVTETGDGYAVVVDVRLSQAQVDKACAELGAAGREVLEAWRARVGLTHHQLVS